MARVKLNSSGVQAVLDDVAEEKCKPLAEAGAERARASAPRASGAYADSIRVYSVRTDRTVWRYGSDLDYAPAIEANTGNMARSL